MPDPGPSDNLLQVVLWTAVVIALLVVLWVVWIMLRRWFLGSAGDDGSGWSLQTLRELRDSDQLSQEEYDTLRRQVIDSYQDRNRDVPVEGDD